jgi:hypothetical protein
MSLIRRTLSGQSVQVDVCGPEDGFVLSVGPVSLWLPATAALDVVETLARAIALDAGDRQKARLD